MEAQRRQVRRPLHAKKKHGVGQAQRVPRLQQDRLAVAQWAIAVDPERPLAEIACGDAAGGSRLEGDLLP
jgi:hypothetical protein